MKNSNDLVAFLNQSVYKVYEIPVIERKNSNF